MQPVNVAVIGSGFMGAGRKPGRDAADFPTFADGHREVEIVEAVLRSHQQQAWVEVGAA